ncbi:MAG: hypothetical protein PUF97_04265 [Bifidobacteriaceae bacterium]|nr:hypothetical protein [Bifidobacteriaceae bacterium]
MERTSCRIVMMVMACVFAVLTLAGCAGSAPTAEDFQKKSQDMGMSVMSVDGKTCQESMGTNSLSGVQTCAIGISGSSVSDPTYSVTVFVVFQNAKKLESAMSDAKDSLSQLGTITAVKNGFEGTVSKNGVTAWVGYYYIGNTLFCGVSLDTTGGAAKRMATAMGYRSDGGLTSGQIVLIAVVAFVVLMMALGIGSYVHRKRTVSAARDSAAEQQSLLYEQMMDMPLTDAMLGNAYTSSVSGETNGDELSNVPVAIGNAQMQPQGLYGQQEFYPTDENGQPIMPQQPTPQPAQYAAQQSMPQQPEQPYAAATAMPPSPAPQQTAPQQVMPAQPAVAVSVPQTQTPAPGFTPDVFDMPGMQSPAPVPPAVAPAQAPVQGPAPVSTPAQATAPVQTAVPVQTAAPVATPAQPAKPRYVNVGFTPDTWQLQ